jgi:hypothetical protein
MRHLITFALFAASAILWYLGIRESAALALAGVGALELLAWKRVFTRHKNT